MNSTQTTEPTNSQPASALEALEQAVDALAAAESQHPIWLDVAVDLLRICRTWQPAPAAWRLLGNEPFETIESTQLLLAAALRGADGLYLEADVPVPSTASPDAVRALVDYLRREAQSGSETAAIMASSGAAPDTLAIALARAAAGAIDEVYGSRFLSIFRTCDQRITISEGQPYPVMRHDARRWTGGRASTVPDNLPTHDLGCLSNVRLGSRLAEEYEFVIDFALWGRLGRVGASEQEGVALAAGAPTLRLNEYRIEKDMSARTYFNRGPDDTDAYCKRMIDQLVTAGRGGAHVLVLPEYSLGEEGAGSFRVELSNVDEAPPLVVVGTVVSDAEGCLEDRASLWALGPRKTRPLEVRVPPKIHGATVDGLREGIITGSQVSLFAGRDWTVAVLICRDAMSAGIAQVLAEAGVNLVLVPSMSPKSAAMISNLEAVVTGAQAFVALANGPTHWVEGDEPVVRGREQSGEERVEAAFLGPYASPAAAVLAPSGRGASNAVPIPSVAARGVWVFDTARRSLRWDAVW